MLEPALLEPALAEPAVPEPLLPPLPPFPRPLPALPPAGAPPMLEVPPLVAPLELGEPALDVMPAKPGEPELPLPAASPPALMLPEEPLSEPPDGEPPRSPEPAMLPTSPLDPWLSGSAKGWGFAHATASDKAGTVRAAPRTQKLGTNAVIHLTIRTNLRTFGRPTSVRFNSNSWPDLLRQLPVRKTHSPERPPLPTLKRKTAAPPAAPCSGAREAPHARAGAREAPHARAGGRAKQPSRMLGNKTSEKSWKTRSRSGTERRSQRKLTDQAHAISQRSAGGHNAPARH